MTTPRDRHARVHLDVDPDGARTRGEPVHDRVFNILVIGDISGVAPGVSPRPLRERRPVLVDRDTIDDLLAGRRPGVRFRLGEAGPMIETTFTCVDDFHPDGLIERVPLLASLAALRDDARAGRAVIAESAAPSPPAATGGSLLDMIIDDASERSPESVPPAGSASSAPRTGASRPRANSADAPQPSDLHGYIRSILAPHIVPDADPGQTALAAHIEETMASVLRAILHHPDVQTLESLWRGVSLLVRRLETGARLRVYLFDASRAAIEADLTSDDAVEGSALLRLMADGAAGPDGSEPWAVVAGHYTFDGSAADAALLGRIAALGRYAGVPFIAGAAPSLIGMTSMAELLDAHDVAAPAAPQWLALRRSALAESVALALPRFLLRHPYDPREEPCETIAFEEMQAPSVHEDYLWGNPAVACALLLGRTFTQSGWEMRPLQLEVDSLPLHLYRENGETVAKPCAETPLSDRAASRILDAGITPLLSMKNGDTVRLAVLQSIADPPAPLTATWSGGQRPAVN